MSGGAVRLAKLYRPPPHRRQASRPAVWDAAAVSTSPRRHENGDTKIASPRGGGGADTGAAHAGDDDDDDDESDGDDLMPPLPAVPHAGSSAPVDPVPPPRSVAASSQASQRPPSRIDVEVDRETAAYERAVASQRARHKRRHLREQKRALAGGALLIGADTPTADEARAQRDAHEALSHRLRAQRRAELQLALAAAAAPGGMGSPAARVAQNAPPLSPARPHTHVERGVVPPPLAADLAASQNPHAAAALAFATAKINTNDSDGSPRARRVHVRQPSLHPPLPISQRERTLFFDRAAAAAAISKGEVPGLSDETKSPSGTASPVPPIRWHTRSDELARSQERVQSERRIRHTRAVIGALHRRGLTARNVLGVTSSVDAVEAAATSTGLYPTVPVDRHTGEVDVAREADLRKRRLELSLRSKLPTAPPHKTPTPAYVLDAERKAHAQPVALYAMIRELLYRPRPVHSTRTGHATRHGHAPAHGAGSFNPQGRGPKQDDPTPDAAAQPPGDLQSPMAAANGNGGIELDPGIATAAAMVAAAGNSGLVGGAQGTAAHRARRATKSRIQRASLLSSTALRHKMIVREPKAMSGAALASVDAASGVVATAIDDHGSTTRGVLSIVTRELVEPPTFRSRSPNPLSGGAPESGSLSIPNSGALSPPLRSPAGVTRKTSASAVRRPATASSSLFDRDGGSDSDDDATGLPRSGAGGRRKHFYDPTAAAKASSRPQTAAATPGASIATAPPGTAAAHWYSEHATNAAYAHHHPAFVTAAGPTLSSFLHPPTNAAAGHQPQHGATYKSPYSQEKLSHYHSKMHESPSPAQPVNIEPHHPTAEFVPLDGVPMSPEMMSGEAVLRTALMATPAHLLNTAAPVAASQPPHAAVPQPPAPLTARTINSSKLFGSFDSGPNPPARVPSPPRAMTAEERAARNARPKPKPKARPPDPALMQLSMPLLSVREPASPSK